MNQRNKPVSFKKTVGEPVNFGTIKLTPQSQSLVLGSRSGGLVWNRPVAVVIEQNGQIEHIPIIDITRIAQIGILGVGFVFSILGFIKFFRRKDIQ